MELNSEGVAFGKRQIMAMAAIAASIFIWAYFLNLTGFTVNDFFTLKISFVLEKVLTVNFLLFLLTFPMTGAIIAAFAKRMDKTNLMAFGTIAGFAALTISMLAFAPLQGFWLIAIFYLISIPLRIETANTNYLELKRWVSPRTFMASAGRGTMVIGIGLFIMSTVTILPEQEQYVEKFEETLFENVFQSLTLGENKNQLITSQAEIVIGTQQQTLNATMNTPLFENLREKTDPDVMAFVASTEALRQQIASPGYKQQVYDQMSANAGRVTQQIDIIRMMKQQFPFIETVERFLWLIQGFVLVSIFFLVANIFFKPMAVAYGLITEKALALGNRNEKKHPANN